MAKEGENFPWLLNCNHHIFTKPFLSPLTFITSSHTHRTYTHRERPIDAFGGIASIKYEVTPFALLLCNNCLSLTMRWHKHIEQVYDTYEVIKNGHLWRIVRNLFLSFSSMKRLSHRYRHRPWRKPSLHPRCAPKIHRHERVIAVEIPLFHKASADPPPFPQEDFTNDEWEEIMTSLELLEKQQIAKMANCQLCLNKPCSSKTACICKIFNWNKMTLSQRVFDSFTKAWNGNKDGETNGEYGMLGIEREERRVFTLSISCRAASVGSQTYWLASLQQWEHTHEILKEMRKTRVLFDIHAPLTRGYDKRTMWDRSIPFHKVIAFTFSLSLSFSLFFSASLFLSPPHPQKICPMIHLILLTLIRLVVMPFAEVVLRESTLKKKTHDAPATKTRP